MNIRLAYLLSKKLSGEISDTEIRELNAALSSDPHLYETIQLLELAWKNDPLNETDEVDVNRLLNKLQIEEPVLISANERISSTAPVVPFQERKPPIRLIQRMLAVAAVFMVVLAVWWVFKPFQRINAQQTVSLNQIATKPGNRTHVTLRDGTKVWLNADSKLTYANDFNGNTREVNLSGEAFFDVVSNPDMPFIIHGNKVTLKVTGTSFNFRDYPDELKSETSLMSGKLEVRLNEDPLRVFYLKPNEKITLKPTASIEIPSLKGENGAKEDRGILMPELSSIRMDPVSNSPIESAWVNDQLAFSDESFRDIADKMEKWYNTTIIFNSQEIEQLRFTGKFETETQEQALMALQFTAPFGYSIDGKTIYIKKK